MAFAIWVKTKSSDNYVFAIDGEPDSDDIIKELKKKLRDEFNYICDCHYDATYKIKFDVTKLYK